MRGHLALILHAHLPFVRHPEHEHFLEEEWFFEAMTEAYIPLLRMMQRLLADRVPFRLTMSITPTLCAMLQDQLLRKRYVRHLELLIDLAEREQKRTRKDPQLHRLANFYFGLFSENRRFFVEECKYDLLSVFQRLAQSGVLEIIASAATHGLLPIVSTAIASGSACTSSHRTRYACRGIRRRARRVLVTRMRLRTWSRMYSTGSQSPMVCARCTRIALCKTAPVPFYLCALSYTGGTGRLRPRSACKPASLECKRRLSG